MLILFKSAELSDIQRQIQHALDPDLDITIPEYFKHNKKAREYLVQYVMLQLGVAIVYPSLEAIHLIETGKDWIQEIQSCISQYKVTTTKPWEFKYFHAFNCFGIAIGEP